MGRGKFAEIKHTMSELALITKKGTKSFDNLEYFFMHWTFVPFFSFQCQFGHGVQGNQGNFKEVLKRFIK